MHLIFIGTYICAFTIDSTGLLFGRIVELVCFLVPETGYLTDPFHHYNRTIHWRIGKAL